MKNVYGYESFLDVPIPEGETRIDIRVPQEGERFLIACSPPRPSTVPAEDFRLRFDNTDRSIRIILKPKPMPMTATLTVEFPLGLGLEKKYRRFSFYVQVEAETGLHESTAAQPCKVISYDISRPKVHT